MDVFSLYCTFAPSPANVLHSSSICVGWEGEGGALLQRGRGFTRVLARDNCPSVYTCWYPGWSCRSLCWNRFPSTLSREMLESSSSSRGNPASCKLFSCARSTLSLLQAASEGGRVDRELEERFSSSTDSCSRSEEGWRMESRLWLRLR